GPARGIAPGTDGAFGRRPVVVLAAVGAVATDWHRDGVVRADKSRPVAGECGAPIRTQGFAPAAAWRRQSSPCGLTAGARPLTSRCADGGARRCRTTRPYRWSRRPVGAVPPPSPLPVPGHR